MRIVHVLRTLDFGGVERRMEIIADQQAGRASHYVFCAIQAGGTTAERLRARGCEVIVLGKPAGIPSLSAIAVLWRTFRRLRPDVVHTHGAEGNFHGLIAAWLAGAPVRIGEEVGIPTHSRLAKLIFRFVHMTSSRTVAISDAVRRWLIDSREVSPAKAVRIYNPVSLPSPVAAVRKAGEPLKVGFVGRLQAVKNVVALIEALPIVRARGQAVELHVVGDGPQLEMLTAKAAELGVADQVRFLGYRADPWAALTGCHVYVQPSLTEGFGLALVEAMGCGLPVIATEVGGAPEIIEHGRTGWLVTPRADSLAAALVEAAGVEPLALHRMGLAARASVEGRFDPVNYVDQLEALYRSLRGRAA